MIASRHLKETEGLLGSTNRNWSNPRQHTIFHLIWVRSGVLPLKNQVSTIFYQMAPISLSIQSTGLPRRRTWRKSKSKYMHKIWTLPRLLFFLFVILWTWRNWQQASLLHQHERVIVASPDTDMFVCLVHHSTPFQSMDLLRIKRNMDALWTRSYEMICCCPWHC